MVPHGNGSTHMALVTTPTNSDVMMKLAITVKLTKYSIACGAA